MSQLSHPTICALLVVLYVGLLVLASPIRVAGSENITFFAGRSARLPCTASKPVLDVLWMFAGPTASRDHPVYRQGQIINGFKTRFSVDRSSQNNDFTLVITNVETADAGVYRCICIGEDGSKEETSIQVAVTTGTETITTVINQSDSALELASPDRHESTTIGANQNGVGLAWSTVTVILVVVVGLIGLLSIGLGFFVIICCRRPSTATEKVNACNDASCMERLRARCLFRNDRSPTNSEEGLCTEERPLKGQGPVHTGNDVKIPL